MAEPTLDPKWEFVRNLIAELNQTELEAGVIDRSSQAQFSLDLIDIGVDVSDESQLFALVVGVAFPVRLALDWYKQNKSKEAFLFLKIRAMSFTTMLTAVMNYLPLGLFAP